MTLPRPFSRLIALGATIFLCVPLAQAEVQVQEVISPGGIVAWLVQDKSLPVTSIEFVFKGSGAAQDLEGKSGTANLLASTLDEGAGDLDSIAFQQALADHSIKLSYSAGQDSFSGSFYTLNRYRNTAISLLRDSLAAPRFDQEPVERIRSQILAGIKHKSMDPGSVANETLMKRIYGNHPYGRTVSGTQASVSGITEDDLKAFMTTKLTRDRLNIGVVGDISPEELGPLLDQIFGDLPETGTLRAVLDVKDPPPAGTLVLDMDIPQSTILFAQAGLKLDDPRYYTAMVLNYVLGGGSFSSLLTNEIRVKRGLAYSVYSFQHPMQHAALLRGGAGTQNARARETVDLVREVMKDLRDQGVPAAMVKDARTYLTGSFPLRFTSSSRIAGQLALMQVYDFPINYLEIRNDLIEHITKQEVDALAKDLLDPEGLTFVLVGRPENITSTLDIPKF